MLRSLRLKTTWVASGTRGRNLSAGYRLYSNEVQRRQPVLPHQSAAQDDSGHHYYSDSLHQALGIVGRFFKFAAIGGVGLGLSVTVAWEGAHQWVEYHELAPIPRHLLDPFEWGNEHERWTAPQGKGGTDPRLGWQGRHLVRAAWISLNWGHGTNASIIQANDPGAGSAGFNDDDALVKAAIYLDSALVIALRKPELARDDGTMDRTVLDLNILHASVLARVGTPGALKSASSIYLRVHDALLREGRNSDAARMAVKLGDISARLNESETAIRWWKGSIALIGIPESIFTEIGVTGKPKAAFDTLTSNDTPSSESAHLQLSPYSQRTLMSALVALSAHYAISGRFKEALATEYATFTLSPGLLRQALTHPSPPPSHLKSHVESQVLHSAFLSHRDALLKVHAAEVYYAIRDATPSSDASSAPKAPSFLQSILTKFSHPSSSPFEPITIPPYLVLLESAVSTTEDNIGFLTRDISPTPSVDSPLPPPEPAAPLVSSFASSPLLGVPAEALLRQAKRTASYAHNLIGILLEEQGDEDQALDHFERALEWAGGREGHDDHTIHSEWKFVWENYVRVREVVLNRDSKEKKS